MAVEDHAAWNVGRYTVHGELASGGMATVHIGRMGAAGGFAKLVAIKRMHPQFAKDPDFLAMFLDEARLATRIRHPNVVQPLDVIVENGEVLLVMEYIHGDALSRINRVLRAKHERIPLRITIAIMSNMLHGLHAAHEAKSEKGEPLGIVHRDVSPQNVIVGVDGVARVLDFGIAKAADQVHLTREGELKGKLVYMAPEQLLGEQLTRRTDIFSAGVVLWECLTGQRLFDSDSQSALLARARMQKVDAPSEFAPEIPPTLDAIVAKGLALDPKDRWPTAREMALALEDAVQPATTTQVSAWVEEVASKALTERQQRIDEIESAGAESTKETRELVKDITSDRVFTQDIISARSASSSGARPIPAPPPPRSAPRLTPTPAPPTSSVRSQQRSRPDFGGDDNSTRRDRATPPPPPASQERASFDRLSMPSAPGISSPIAPTAPSVHNPYYVPPAAPAPSASGPLPPISLEAPAIPTELAKPAKTTVVKMGRKGYGSALVLLVLVLFLVGLLGSPALVRRSFIDALAKRGIVATIDEVDLYSQIGTARVVGLAMTSPDVPGTTVRAREVLVDLNGDFDPKQIIARDVDVNIEVGYAPLLKSLDAWSKKNGRGTPLSTPDSLQHARVESGHVVWNQPSGPDTKLEARSMTLDLSPRAGRKLGEDFAMEPTSFDLTTPIGPAGPWLIDANKSGPAWKTHLSFNQAHQQSYDLDAKTTDDGTIKIDLRVPKAPPSEIGMKPDAFGAAPTDVVKVDATAHAERSKAGVWAANATLAIEGFHVPMAKPGTLTLGGSIAGATSQLDVRDGRLGFGLGEAGMVGTVTIADDGFVAKLGAAPAIRCDDGSTRAQPLTITIDTRALGSISMTPPTRLCAKK